MTGGPKTPKAGIAHEAAFRAIPWLVNGTLEPAEAARLEAHLVACPACRAEADWQRGLQGAVAAAADPDPGAGADAAWPRIEARIGAAPRRGHARRPRLLRLPRWPAFAAGGAAAAALALALGLLAPSYRTLTGGDSPTAAAGLVEVRIRPAPGASEARIRAALDAAGIEAAPERSATGLLRVTVEGGRRDAVLDILRSDADILVVAADPAPSPPPMQE